MGLEFRRVLFRSKANLVNFYRGKGYRDADIVVDSIIKLNEERLKLYVRIDEGNLYYFRDRSEERR